MHQQNILDADDYRRKKINFWLLWTLGNAFGAAAGWVLGELFGSITLEMFGVRSSLLIASLFFEISVWLPRILISRYFRELKLLGYFEMMIWMISELGICIIADLLPPKDLSWLTVGSGIANILGPSMSILFLIIGLSDSKLINRVKKEKVNAGRVIKNAFTGLFGFTVIVILFFVILKVATTIGDNNQTFSPIVYNFLSGLLFGGGIGAITGIGYIKLINRQENSWL